VRRFRTKRHAVPSPPLDDEAPSGVLAQPPDLDALRERLEELHRRHPSARTPAQEQLLLLGGWILRFFDSPGVSVDLKWAHLAEARRLDALEE
jgi:hypothetical protein